MKRLVGLTRGQRNNSKFSRACSGTSLATSSWNVRVLGCIFISTYIEQFAVVYSSSFSESWIKSMVVIKASVGTPKNLLHAKYFHVGIWWRHSYPKGKKKPAHAGQLLDTRNTRFASERTVFHSAPKLCGFFGVGKDIWDWNGKRGEGLEEVMRLWEYFCRKQILLSGGCYWHWGDGLISTFEPWIVW